MRWNGGKKGEPPVAFIGKGVCFDTGGISIKPAAGMEDMKGDMAGAACVTGLMQALAARKAKVNAVGVVGLVENMPDGKAQRPGDIVTSMSGQTVEIINTDAEGRLVLGDVIWYAAQRFKPKFMVDLATLTGAIIVALGHEYAGMFANDDQLAERLAKAGEETGELVWRMPLAKEYDKLIDSKFADMKNTGGSRWGGAITAAQFIKRFVDDKTPWAHLDIAGTGFDSPPERHQQELGLGLGRAAARPAGGGSLRGLRRKAMTELLFYHLQGQKLEGVLTPLLEKSLERGWRVVVQGASEERIDALDAHLWTYRDDGFLPHGTWREAEAAAAAGAAHGQRGQSERRQRALPDRGRAGAGGRRKLPTYRAGVRRRGRGGARRRACALGRCQGQGLRGHLLAAGRGRALGQEGLKNEGSANERPAIGLEPNGLAGVTFLPARALPDAIVLTQNRASRTNG